LSAISDTFAALEADMSILGSLLIVGSSLVVAFDTVVGDVLTPEVWVIVASVVTLVDLLLNAIPVLPPELPSVVGVVLTPLSLFANWQGDVADPNALSLASNVVGTLPTIINPIKFASLETAAPLLAPVADIACALAVAGMTLSATIGSWDNSGAPRDV
jgi:hypothetical protein